MDTRPIGMFDSGVGGITVLKEIKKLLPNEKIIYLGDTKSFPYGNKSKESIVELTKLGIKFLVEKNVKLVVIACGTATSQALQEVSQEFNIPIIGIINPTVDYIKEKCYTKIGVIATRGTIRSKGWENEILNKIKDAQITSKACALLAPMAEEGWTDNKIAKEVVKEYIKDVKNIEALVLGCTHYPLFEKLIKDKIGKKVEIINAGKPTAKAVKEILQKENLQSNINLENNKENAQIKNNSKAENKICLPNIEGNSEIEDEIYLSDIECNFVNSVRNLLRKNVKVKEAVIRKANLQNATI